MIKNLAISNNISFGKLIPTRTAVELASGYCFRRGQFGDNIDALHELIGYETDLYVRGSIGTSMALQSVGDSIRKECPKLTKFADKIIQIHSKPKRPTIPKEGYDRKTERIMRKAEAALGKEFDMPEDVIREALNLSV